MIVMKRANLDSNAVSQNNIFVRAIPVIWRVVITCKRVSSYWKYCLLFIALFFLPDASTAQVRSNGANVPTITGENAFLDAASNFVALTGSDASVGKGLIFPRADLTVFEFNTNIVDEFSFNTLFDGMIVYNVGTGNTVVNNGLMSAVTPGFYYFSNPTGDAVNNLSVTGGNWVRIADQNDLKTTPSGATLPSTPAPKPGDVFYNTTTKSLYYYKDTQWVPVSSTPSGSALPLDANSKVGDVFYQTNANPALDVLKIFDGTAWVNAGVTLDATGENYLTLTGQTLKANPLNLSGTNATGILAAGRFPALTGDITTTAGALATTLKSTGTAGTYKSVTTDEQGRVTSGTNPTTLGGYGITDAASAAHTHALSSLTDVAIPSPTSGDVLQWNGSKWVNNPIVTGNQSISFTPNAAGDVTGTATGATLLTPTLVIGAGKVTNSMLAGGIDLTTKVTGVLPIANIPAALTGITSLNGLTLTSLSTGFSIAGGTSPKTLIVTDNASLSGTNTGDQVASSVPISAITGVTGTTVQAALSDIKSQINTNAADITSKLTGNTAITPGTKTKITYDAKGLVTAGADATTADIATAADKRYVTDAQLANITTLSGTNTGDQTLSLAGSNLTISGANGNTVTGIGDITGVTAGTGLSGGGTSGDVTLNLGTNAVGTVNMKGSGSNPLDYTGSTGFVLKSNGDGTFSWLDISSGVSANPGSLSLGTGQFFIGDGGGKASAISKNAISLGGFAAADADVDMGNKKIVNLATPINPADAANKAYADTKIAQSVMGVASGVAPLNALGKIDEAFLPGSLVGAVNYVGTYDATSGSITAANSGNKGNYYVISVAGSYNSVSYAVGDWIISDGTQWSKVSNNNGVTTIFGRAGVVTAVTGDYKSGQVPETTNLYYTEARVNANATVVGKEDKTNKSTNVVTDGGSDTMYPSVKAVKTYVDDKVPASAAINNGQVLTVNASGNPVWQAVSGTGTVTNVSVTANAGVTGVVTDPTTTPAIALTLGDITPTSVTTSGTVSAGSVTATTISATGTITGSNIPAGATITGSNTGDQQITLTGAVTGTGAAKTTTIATTISDDAITSAKILDGTITNVDLAAGSIESSNLKNIAGPGTSGQILTSNGGGGFSWAASAATDLGYTASATNGIVTSNTGADATIPAGSTANASLMLPGDKTKLDGIAAGATNYVLPKASGTVLGGIKVGANLSIDASGVLSATSSGLSAINASSLLGNNTGSSAVPVALDATAVKTLLSLSNVENTSDASKQISTATQSALDLKQNISNISNTLATDASSTVKYPSVKAIKDYVDTQVSTAVPGATSSTLGTIMLAGDLGGTASSPSVSKVGGSTAAAINSATVAANGATSANTTGAIVQRDGSGNFTAGTITANLTGTASTAAALQTGRTISITGDLAYTSPAFNGSGNVTAAGTIANNAVTYAKMQTMTANRLLGSGAAGTAVSEITLGTNLSFTGNTLNVTSGSGDMLLGTAQSVTATKTFDNSTLAMKGTGAGVTTISTANTTGTYTLTLPAATGTVALTSLPLNQFAATTSVQLAGVISDETGSGALVFANTPTFVTPVLGAATATSVIATGNLSGSQLTSTATTGTAPFSVVSTTPVPNLSIGGTAANIAGGTAGDILYQSALGITAKLTKGTAGQVLTMDPTASFPTWTTISVGGGGDMLLATPQSVTGLKTFDNSILGIKGTSTGVTTLATANTTATNYTLTLPAATGTVALSTLPLSQFASTTSAQLAGIISDKTGSGALVFADSPSFTTPNLGAANAASLIATGAITTSGSISSTGGNITSTTGYVQGTQLKSTVAVGTAPFVVTSTTPVSNLSIGGNAATATNIAGGAGGQVLYQSAPGVTAMLGNGTAGQVLTSSGGTSAPTWTTVAAGGGLPTATIPADANKVLTVNSSTGAAQWQSPAGGGTTNLSIYALADFSSGIGPVSSMVRASGPGITIGLNGTSHSFLVTIPAGVTLDYFRLFSTYTNIGAQANMDITFTFLGKELYNNLTDLIFPMVQIVDQPAYTPATGAATMPMAATGSGTVASKVTLIKDGTIQLSELKMTSHMGNFYYSVRF
jgi:hypothetical protein